MDALDAGDVDRPEISIIIPCYNANDTLALQLEALSRQVAAPDFEVLVVDNRSSPPPDIVVAEWTDRVPRLRLVRAPEAQGISCARNVGLREALAPKIAICDADDCAGPSFVRSAWRGTQEATFVTGNVISLSPQRLTSVDEVWALLPEKDPDGPVDMNAVDPAYPIMMGGCCAYDREAALALGGYDLAYTPGVEDNDFALRVIAAGHRIGHKASMTLAERRRATGASAFRRSYDGGRMHMKLCARHDLWERSPHLRHPRWWVDLLKTPLAGVKMLLTPKERRDMLSVASRTGLRVGQLVGCLEYGVLHRSTSSRPGIGLQPTATSGDRP